jgi:hypothetical protein
MLRAASGADTANSNTVEWPTPQLSVNTNPRADVPMAREIDPAAAPPAAPVPPATPAAAPSRNIWAVILAVLVLVVSRFVLRRLRSRSGQS